MPRYALAEHVFVCSSGEHVVMLDVRQDRYFAVEASKTAVLGALVRGWPVVPVPEGRTEARSEACEEPANGVAGVLLRQGLLTEAPGAGKDATPIALPAPAQELASESSADHAPIRVHTVLAFLSAAIAAKWALRFHSFERVIEGVRRRKEARAAQVRPLDVERVRQLVESFALLRVFVFSSRNECLYDSLALLGFLARQGLFPGWVFGVRARPFAAHCWVQEEGVVLNDTVEHVSGYTPIMVV